MAVVSDRALSLSFSCPCEVNEAARYVGVNEFHANVVADIETLEALDYPAFSRRP
jgi:hypothetical protein